MCDHFTRLMIIKRFFQGFRATKARYTSRVAQDSIYIRLILIQTLAAVEEWLREREIKQRQRPAKFPGVSYKTA